MKKLHSFALYALVTPAITFGAGSVLGQQSTDQEAKQSTPKTAQDDQSKHRAGMSHGQNRSYLDSAPANGLQANNLIGAEVKTTGDEEVGPVGDLIIDEDGQVVAIVVSVGGFLGMGEKDVAIGWDDVKRSGASDELKLRVDLTREGLSSAPKFDAKQATAKTEQSGTAKTEQSATAKTAQSDHSAKHAMQSDSQTAADRRNASDQSRTENRGYLDSAPANGLQASNLIGTEVTITGDENVGSVGDLIIDEDGQIVAIVVGVGGFLSMGERNVAIAWDDVKRSGASDELKLRIDATREGLSSAPEFEQQVSQRDKDAKQSTAKTEQSATARTEQSATAKTAQSGQSKQHATQSDSHPAAARQNASDQSRTQNRGYLDSAPASGLQASNLIGADVKTTGDERVGPVSDLIIDEDGQIVAVVVGVGGFLGMGQRNVAIGWDDVARSGSSNELELRIDVTAEALRSAPKFETRD